MNIHEHQAKDILKKFGIPVPDGFVVYKISEIEKKIKLLNNNSYVVKAQIHAGGRGKAGGIKLVKTKDNILKEANNIMGKKLITPQTGPEGKIVKRLYIEETLNISKEFYLSCLIDRSSAKIAFISSSEGGMDIEKISKEKPQKIVTVKISSSKLIQDDEIKKIISPFNLSDKASEKASKIVKSIYRLLVEKDASLIEINPLVLTMDEDLFCLDAKINFDDNALYRHEDIQLLKDPNEIDPIELEASKHDLSYIKLNGNIGCMVNGAGLAMATLDIIKLYGSEPANFLDVGGGASKEKVSAALKIILSDKNVKGILINIFGGIMRCDVLAQGVVDAAKEIKIEVPLVVRLAGTKFEEGKKILDNSGLAIISASDLSDAAKKVVNSIK